MKNLRVLIVFNSPKWDTETERIKEVREWFLPKVNLQVSTKYTDFKDIPFVYYAPDMKGVEESYYDEHVTSLGKGYDILLFVIPLTQWPWQITNARGWRTDRDQGPIELQVGTGEKDKLYITRDEKTLEEYTFYEFARHELTHALYMLTGQEDKTHEYFYAVPPTPEKALEHIQFPDVNDAIPEGYLDMLALWLQKVLAWTYNPVGKPPEIPKEIMPEPPIAPVPPQVKRPSLTRFCLAIQQHEDYVLPGGKYRDGTYSVDGSLSFRNKNPGNLKYVGQILATGADRRGFAIFKSYDDGFNTLKRSVYNAAIGKSTVYHPDMTFYGYFAKFAPSSDHNNPNAYAEAVAADCGVSPITTISQLVAD